MPPRRSAAVAALGLALAAAPATLVQAQGVQGQEVQAQAAQEPQAQESEARPQEVRGRKAAARRAERRDRLSQEVGLRGELEARISAHAKANGVPESLVHRVIMRESRYNPRAVGRGGVYGLMQLKHGTARALGYAGTPSGLLDADTNLTYGVRYLAGAYKVADGDPNRAVSFFARGYYYDAKRKGLAKTLAAKPTSEVEVAEATVPAETDSAFTSALRSATFDEAAPPDPARD